MTPEQLWRIYPRLQSILFVENVWGTLSAFLVLYCLATRTLARPVATRRYWALLGLAFVCLALTISRGALITLAIGAFILFLFRGRHRSRIAFCVATAILSISGVLWYFADDPRVAFVLKRADTISLQSAQQGTLASDRVFQWVAGWNIFLLYPSGKGFGTAGFAASLSKGGSHVVADGMYFRVLAEQGIPGILMFAFMLIGVAYILVQSLRRATGWTRVLGLTLLSFHCGFCVQSIGANTFDYYYFPAVFWMLFGCYVSLIERGPEKPSDLTTAPTSALVATTGRTL